uniref:Uncharacterized protein n=1 Tax=Dictyoglomus thermophilum TaxID=14 RepID=A0A7C3RKS4_DICTH
MNLKRFPNILLALKNTVDKTQRKMKFILSGSSTLEEELESDSKIKVKLKFRTNDISKISK